MSAPLSVDEILATFQKNEDGIPIGTAYMWHALALVEKEKFFHSCRDQRAFDLVREHLRNWRYLVMEGEAFTSKLTVALNWPVMNEHASKKDFVYFLRHI
jgi:hypothetical protein